MAVLVMLRKNDSPAPRRLSPNARARSLAARNRLWLRLKDELRLTVVQIADHVSAPVRTVQRGILWARTHPQTPEQDNAEAYERKLTARTARYAERLYANSTDPAVREWLASLRRRN